MTWTEILGFVTGAASVWLAVRESVWNWPVGRTGILLGVGTVAATALFATILRRFTDSAAPLGDSVEAIAASHRHDFYLLTSCDLPFVQDGLRDGETIRQWMTKRFEDVLTECGLRWVQISGRGDQRHSAATSEVEKLLA